MKKKRLKLLLPVFLFAAAAVMISGGFWSGKKLAAKKLETGVVTGVVSETATIEGGEEKVFFAGVSAPVGSFSLKEGDTVKKDELLLSYDTSDLEHEVSSASIARAECEARQKGTIEKSDENKRRYEKARYEDETYAVLYARVRESADALSERQYGDDYQALCATDGIGKSIAEKNQEILDKTQELDKVLDKISAYTIAGEEAPKRLTKKKKKLRDELNDLNDQLYAMQTEAASVYSHGFSPEENAEAADNKNLLEDIGRNWEEAKTEKQNYEASFLNEGEKEVLLEQTNGARESERYAMSELEKAADGISSPFDGVVMECDVKEGSYVKDGERLFVIRATDDIRAKVGISRFDIGSIAEGQEALISTADKDYHGHVSRIERRAFTDESDKSRIDVEVTIDDADESLIIGVESRVTIFTERSDSCVMVPAEAVYTDDGGDYCYIIEDGKIEKVYFETGVKNDDYVEAVSGLKEGQTVITDAVTDQMTGERAVGLTD